MSEDRGPDIGGALLTELVRDLALGDETHKQLGARLGYSTQTIHNFMRSPWTRRRMTCPRSLNREQWSARSLDREQWSARSLDREQLESGRGIPTKCRVGARGQASRLLCGSDLICQSKSNRPHGHQEVSSISG
jgi:hypothetical protein